MHSTTKKELQKIKIKIHSLKQQHHQKFSFFKNNASKKETEHEHHHRPIKDLRFSPWRKSLLSKQCLQQGHCYPHKKTRTLPSTTIKARP
jgi:hypothetical protein